MFKIINKLLNNEFGGVLISILLGIGLASIFKKSCKGKECIEFIGPPFEKINNQIYIYDNNCYKFNENHVKCGTLERTVDFA